MFFSKSETKQKLWHLTEDHFQFFALYVFSVQVVGGGNLKLLTPQKVLPPHQHPLLRGPTLFHVVSSALRLSRSFEDLAPTPVKFNIFLCLTHSRECGCSIRFHLWLGSATCETTPLRNKKCADRVEAQVISANPNFIFKFFICRSGQNICPFMSEDMPKIYLSLLTLVWLQLVLLRK